jgi:hypothetical protein
MTRAGAHTFEQRKSESRQSTWQCLWTDSRRMECACAGARSFPLANVERVENAENAELCTLKRFLINPMLFANRCLFQKFNSAGTSVGRFLQYFNQLESVTGLVPFHFLPMTGFSCSHYSRLNGNNNTNTTKTNNNESSKKRGARGFLATTHD